MRLLRPVLLLVLAAATVARAQHGDMPMAAGPVTTEQLRADLATFRTEFLDRDKSFAPDARAEAERRLAALEGALGKVSFAKVELELAQVAALADNGHTHAVAGGIAMRHNRVPMRLTPFGDDQRVLRARGAALPLLGGRLVSIDGHPIEALRAAARTLAGGTAAWRDRFANVLLESPELLHELGLADQPDAARYAVQLADGRRVEARLAGETNHAGSPAAPTSRWLSPERLAQEDTAWRAALAEAQAPWALQQPATFFRWREAPEVRGVVLQLRATVDVNGQSLKDALAAMTDLLKRTTPTNIVLDMRTNGGGDLTRAREFMRSLPGLATGTVYVLTSPWTFSAAISSVGYLKQAAPEKVVIVGEPVGDRLMFWAEGRGATLPNSKMAFGLATQRHDYQTGCKGYKDCHGNVVFFPIAVPTLEPAIAAPWTYEAYAAGRDPAMDAVVKAVGAR
ncbi:MAG: hypothetical protein HY275_15320 [Gemmatimonadetes bacterium]|nr:hypothetical protein [Gemmatimonadota bacterium]